MSDIYGGSGGGSGVGWIDPTVDKTETFDESDVTVTLGGNGMEIASGNLQLGTTLVDGTTVSRANDDSSQGYSVTNGLLVNPNKELAGVKAEVSNNTSGVTTAYLKRHSDGTVLDSTTDLSGGSFQLEATLSSGTDYRVVVDAGGSSYTGGFTQTGGFNYTSTDIDIVNAIYDGGTIGDERAVNNITALESGGATSDDAKIEFDSGIPLGIREWDCVAFDRTLDGETVTVDVEDAAGNVLYSDVPHNFNLSPVSTDKEVVIRINISRTDTGNNPQCNLVERRSRVEE